MHYFSYVLGALHKDSKLVMRSSREVHNHDSSGKLSSPDDALEDKGETVFRVREGCYYNYVKTTRRRTNCSSQLSVILAVLLLLLCHISFSSCLKVVNVNNASRDVVKALRAHGFVGTIYTKGTQGYQKLRLVVNGACNHRYPLVIVRPVNTYDVAAGVKVARLFNLPVSVRSGGHSYICMSIKDGSLHFDMRRMNKVELLPPSYSYVSEQQEKPILKAPTMILYHILPERHAPPPPGPWFHLGESPEAHPG